MRKNCDDRFMDDNLLRRRLRAGIAANSYLSTSVFHLKPPGLTIQAFEGAEAMGTKLIGPEARRGLALDCFKTKQRAEY